MTRIQIKERLQEAGVGKMTFHRDGTVTACRTFFYTHGYTADKLAKRIAEYLPIKVTEVDEIWNDWPKDSYWAVTFRLEA